MGVTIAVTRVAATIDTPPYNQDIITTDLGGLTPKAAWFIISGAVSDATPVDDASIGFGAATATDARWATAVFGKHGVGTTDDTSRGVVDKCVLVLTDAGAVDGEADFVTFIENGVRISWTDAPSVAYLLTVVLFAGTDLSAKADYFARHATVDQAVDVTNVGFLADVLILAAGDGLFDDSPDTDCSPSVGIVLNKVTDEQYSNALRATTGQTTSKVDGGISAVYGPSNQIFSGGGFYYYACEYGGFDAQGFSCTSRNNGGVTNIGYLALAFNGAVSFEGGIIDSPTSTGEQTVTDPGFTPQFVMVGLTQSPAINTVYSNENAGSLGVSVFDGDEAYCSSIQHYDGQPTTDTQSLSDDTVVNLPDDDGSAAHVASFVSFEATGWKWNFSATEDPAVKYWYLAIEAEAVGALPMAMHHYKTRRAA